MITVEEAINELSDHILATSRDDTQCFELTNANCVEIQRLLEQLENENSELKARLEGAIIPKFRIGQEVIYNAKYLHKLIIDRRIIDVDDKVKYEFVGMRWFDESELFSTEAEALASLKEGV